MRFSLEHFLVCCSIADIVQRCRRRGNDALPDKVAIQLDDTHPAPAVAELLRTLLDEAGLGRDEAWNLTRPALAYTNHTLLPEALGQWPLTFSRRIAGNGPARPAPAPGASSTSAPTTAPTSTE